MGYTQSDLVIKRMKPILDQLLEAESGLAWATDDAHMLAYHIREALTLAEKKRIAPYENLKSKFIIRNRGTRVVAELRNVDILSTLKKDMQRVILPDLHTAVEIVGAAVTNGHDIMFFPDAELTKADKLMVYNWAKKNEYFMVVNFDDEVTLTKSDPGDAAWTPE